MLIYIELDHCGVIFQLIFVSCDSSEAGSGGLIIMWCPENFQLARTLKGDRWLLLVGKVTIANWMCAIILLYGGNADNHRVEIYNEISNILQLI